jgi:hypothetical protein
MITRPTIARTVTRAPAKEVLAFCKKCKVPRNHLIVTLKSEKSSKVQCKICGGEHRFVSPDFPKGPARPKQKKEAFWEELLKPLTAKIKIPYTLSGRYRGNDVIQHPTFGVGIVTQVLSREKVLVVFKEGEKLLASGRPTL